MYLAFYNLLEKPFNINTDPRFLWRGEKHQEALANLKYGLMEANGYVVLTGDVGTGKTTLVNALIEALDDNVLVANINHPTLDTVEFFNLIAKTYDASARITSKTDFLFFFKDFLQRAHDEGKVVLLVIDEAHRLSRDLLEEIRLLSNVEQAGNKLINIIFVGQDELKDVILCPECRALRQRITLFYDIEPLSGNETHEYVNHRLNVAGTDERLFSPAAVREIQNFTRGYPRLINILCDRALLTGYVKEQKVIGADIIVECAQEISFLDPRASTVRTSQIDRFSSWGRSPADREREPTASLESEHDDEEGPQGHEPSVDLRVERVVHPISGSAKPLNRRVLIPIGLAAIIVFIIIALGVGMHSEPPIAIVEPPGAGRSITGSRADVPVGKNGESALQKSPTAAETGAVAKVSESAIEASPPVKQDPNATQSDEKTASTPAPVSAVNTAKESALPTTSVLEEGEGSAENQTPETSGPPPAKPPQPTTLELASAALEEGHFQTAIDLIEAERTSVAGSDLQAREIYSKALAGQAFQIYKTAPSEAEALLRRAVEANPKNVDAYLGLGRIYTRSKDYTLAIDAYQKAVALNPKLSDAFFNLGFIYATTGMYEDAEKLFVRVVQLEPAYLDKAFFNLAVTQERLGKREECLANLQMAIMIRPENQKAQNYLKKLTGEAGETR